MSESTPIISIIVVTYNQEDFIARTLDSILSQITDFPIEVLVSDDASADSTSAVALRYSEKFPEIVKVHRNEKNMGVQANYFGALRRCRGKYIADCAGDDYWIDPNKLQKQFELMESHPATTIVHTGWNYLYPDGSSQKFIPKMPRAEFEIDGRETAMRLLTGTDAPALHLCTALYRRDAALKVLADNEELFLNPEYKCEDLQLAFELCMAGNVIYMPQATLNYSVGHQSLSSEENFGKLFDFYFGTLKLRVKLAQKHNIPSEKTFSKFSALADYLTAQAFRDGDPQRARIIREYIGANGFNRNFKTRIYNILMSNSAIWKAARKFRDKI